MEAPDFGSISDGPPPKPKATGSNTDPRTKKGITILLVFTFEPDRSTVQDFESDWYIRGPGDAVPLTFRHNTGKRAEWSAPLTEDHFDAVADVCQYWMSNGRVKRASLLEEDEYGQMRRFDLGAPA